MNPLPLILVLFFLNLFMPLNNVPVLTRGRTCFGSSQQKVAAFPGAQGCGMFTTGGRGGRVIRVTNLNDKGEGSFRNAIETPGARTIIFNVSGTIALEKPLDIKHGDLTIAGQSAPGDGICVKGHEVRINANNVIIRFMRFRPGDIAGQEYDALTGIGQKDIIIDHCSMSWSTDETVSFYDNENFTLQWCIISESLDNSVHSKGAHGYGGIWGGMNASFHHNLLAHHASRNPRLQGSRSHGESNLEKSEITYNIIYNWGNKAIYGGEKGRYNICRNLFIPGPATSPGASGEFLEPYKPYGQYYIHENILEGLPDVTSNNWTGVSIPGEKLPDVKMPEAFQFPDHIHYFYPEDTYSAILNHAGASLSRDAVDNRVVNEVKNRSYAHGRKGILDSQEDAGGWPVLQSGKTWKDSDGDGIPDSWEKMHQLDPDNPSDGKQYNLHTDYTNLEVFLNELVKNCFPKNTKSQ